MPIIRLRLYFCIKGGNRKINTGEWYDNTIISLINCRLNIPDTIYEKIVQITDYNDYTYLAVTWKNDEEIIRCMRQSSYHRNIYKIIPIPDWFKPYILSFSNYSLDPTMNLSFSPPLQYVPAESQIANCVIPEFNCFDQAYRYENPVRLSQEEYLSKTGVDVAYLQIPQFRPTIG